MHINDGRTRIQAGTLGYEVMGRHDELCNAKAADTDCAAEAAVCGEADDDVDKQGNTETTQPFVF